MATQTITNSTHDDMIHDAVLDYYGRRLATCSSDRTIKIFDIDNDTHTLTSTLKGHDGAVWSIAWAHPKYGTILASASYDGRVLIWRETPNAPNQWTQVYTYPAHTASVNLVAWAPHEVGCVLASASSDGAIAVLEFKDAGPDSWDAKHFVAHGLGVNGVSWAPSYAPGGVTERATSATPVVPLRRFASGGSDCTVKVWEFAPQSNSYNCIVTLGGHTDWVRDVAWSPTVLSKTYLASASQDKTVRIWTLGSGQDPSNEASWKCSVLEFDHVVWRVSWSLSGNILAVSGGDNKVTLWKERVRDGGWEKIKTLED